MTQLFRLQSLATALVLLRFCLGWCQISHPHDASGHPPPLHPEDADLPEAWRRAQVSIKKGGFCIRDSVLHSLAAFLASSSSTAALCNRRLDADDTPDPAVDVAGTEFRRTIHDDAAWRPSGTTSTQQATQRNRMSLEPHQVPVAGAWLVGGPNSVLIDCDNELNQTALQHRIPASLSYTVTVDLVRQSATVTTPRSAHVLEIETANTVRWPTSSTKPL